MKLLPVENLKFKSKLTSNEVLTKIELNLEPKKYFRRQSNKPFVGEIDNRTFNITRSTLYRNTYIPRILGSVSDQDNGSEVNIKLRLRVQGLLKIGMLLIFYAFVLTSLIISGINPAKAGWYNLIPITVLILLYFVVMMTFNIESKKALNYLEKLLELEK